MKLRAKVTISILSVVTLAMISLSVFVVVLVRAADLDEARSSELVRLDSAYEIYNSASLTVFGSRVNDPNLPKEAADSIPEVGSRTTYIAADDMDTVWSAVRISDGDILSLHGDTRISAVITELSGTLFLSSIATILTMWLVAYGVAGGIARRMRTAARAASELGTNADSAARISVLDAVGGGRDEVADLARAVDTMADALSARISAERQFTADVAHDLRTPVTGLLTAAELLPPGRPTELVQDRAKALARLVQELLEVARLDSGTEEAQQDLVDLTQATASILRRMWERGELPRVEVDKLESLVTIKDLGGDHLVFTDVRRLERIVENLLNNALSHGEPPIEICILDNEITVHDSGVGFPAILVADGPLRFATASAARSTGNGLGLTIAVGQAEVLKASLTLENDPSGGATARLRLPQEPAVEPHPISGP